MGTSVTNHLEIRRPSIVRIKELCEESLDHDASWYEFVKRLEDIVDRETRMIKMLSSTPKVPNEQSTTG